MFIGAAARALRNRYELQLRSGTLTGVLRGHAASPGVVRGIVRIVKTREDFTRVRIGDILVTSMTRPEFLPVMRRAAAFVTDEGGLTCHAAIVARELGKPCVIGTQVATSLLKNNSRVEVDGGGGIVTVIRS